MNNNLRFSFDSVQSPNASMAVEEKSSCSRVKKKVGIYSFRIEGYSGLSTKMGVSTESPEFGKFFSFLFSSHFSFLRL